MIRTWRRWLLLICAGLGLAGPARAQGYGGSDGATPASPPGGAAIASPDFRDPDDQLDRPLNPGGQYRPGVPSPEEFLGSPLGARFTRHHRLIEYAAALAGTAADRVSWEPYGESVEGRPLGVLVITAPQNRSRLAALRHDLARLAEPDSLTGDEARRIIRDSPLVVWLSFNVHGDEASGSETALAVAYELAAGSGAEVTGLLDSLVVLIDPCLNPDGRERYVSRFEQRLGRVPQADGASWEHREAWPGGRDNHYLFDLNRDWAWLTQDESRARAAAFRRWRPQVHVDFHEMRAGSTYFFFPAAEPINANLPPQVRRWADRFGRGNSEAFDDQGWSYFTAEQFDLYYPGYGDSWPTLQGATGMTYEQAGHSHAGLALRRSDGSLLTLRERVRRHFVAAMATLRTARRARDARLTDYRDFFEEGLNGRTGGPAAWLFPPGADPNRTAELIELLLRHGVRVERATGRLNVSEPRGDDGRIVHHDFPAGTWIVPGRQPLAALAASLLEPEAALPETLFYDISAWSLPMAFGVESAWTDRNPSGPRVPVHSAVRDSGGVDGGPARAGWLIPWETNDAPRLLEQLLRRGARARFATRNFELDGRPFERGTIFVPKDDNPDTLGAMIERLARRHHVRVMAARTALTGSGIDLGSDRFLPVRPPRVAILAGDGVEPTSFGALWFLLDRTYEIPASVISIESLSRVDLSEYNVIVFPDDEAGDGTDYEAAIDSTEVHRFRSWLEAGGTFVGLKGGAAWATATRSGLTDLSLREAPSDSVHDAADEAAGDDLDEGLRRRLATRDERERDEVLDSVPGTILRVELDATHPLAYGYTGEARVIKTSKLVFETGERGQNVAWYPPMARVSGYISVENEEALTHTPFLSVASVGRGHAVLYADDPNFRVFWFGLNRLFLNSLFFTAGL